MAPRSSSPPWAPMLGGLLVLGLVAGLLWWFAGDDAAPREEPAPTADAEPVVGPQPRPPAPLPAAPEAGEPERLAPTTPAQRAAELAEEGNLIVARGRVLDPDGNPVANQEVNLFDVLGDYLDSEATDDDGAFALEWDEPLVAGWALATEVDPFSDQDDPGSLVPAHHRVTDRWVPGNPPVEVDLVLQRAPRLEGRVIDDATGAPIEFADVEIVSVLPSWVDEWQDCFTEEDGSFAVSIVDLPRQGLVVRATDDEDRTAVIGPFDLAPGEVRYLELRVGAGFDLTGVVRTLQGTPVNGAEVLLLPLHPDLEFDDGWDITLEDGVFVFTGLTVGADQVMIYAQADDFGPVIVRPREPRAPVDILLGGLVTVEGRVLESESGEPIEAADLTFVLRGPGGALLDDYEDYAYTDDDGRFELQLELVPPEAAELIVESEDHVTRRIDLADLAPVNSNWKRYEVEVRLDPLP